MKVLWFTNLPPAGFGCCDSSGGGWISALYAAIVQKLGVNLGVAFFAQNSVCPKMENDDGAGLFPLSRHNGLLSRTGRFFLFSRQDNRDLSACEAVVRDFRPDIVHVFGTERVFGLLAKHLDIPVLVHLQGLMGPIMNAWVPPGYRAWDYALQDGFNPVRIALRYRALAFNRHAAARERDIMRSCKMFMGRTEWDRAYVSLYAPQARYFHCEEALRPEFFSAPPYMPPSGMPVFVSTLSSPLYKGHDVILKTAKTLCEAGFGRFEWRVFGVSDIRFSEKRTGVKAGTVHVSLHGRVSAHRLRDELLHATAYVHPSYIDNSPNSVCEAQVLGIPVISTNVGGVSSIIDEGKTGFLVPPNDPILLAYKMRSLSEGKICLPPGWSSTLKQRNDPSCVASRVLDIYQEVLSCHANR